VLAKNEKLAKKKLAHEIGVHNQFGLLPTAEQDYLYCVPLNRCPKAFHFEGRTVQTTPQLL
jgi:hypothetical protein